MWFLSKIALVGTLIFLMLQNSTQPAGKTSSPKGASAGSQGSKEVASTSSTVGPTEAVITVRGLCEGSAQKSVNDTSCTKVITREEFETLVAALNPEGQVVPPLARQNLAKNFADFLAVEAVAKKAGIEDTAEFRELMNWARLRTVTDLYRRSLQEKYRNPSPEEIAAYYKQHYSEFERVSLARILVTRESASATDKDSFDKKALEAAKAARARAAKGEDPAQIQKDAYAALGLSVPPSADLGKRRRADLITSEAAEVFSLPEGGITQVQTEARSYVIYKVLSKDAMTEKEAEPEITREIYQQKFKAAMKSVLGAAPAEFNKEYFGTTMRAKSE